MIARVDLEFYQQRVAIGVGATYIGQVNVIRRVGEMSTGIE